MTRWSEIAAAEPEFAQQVLKLFASRTSVTVATLRRDGSPRLSGVSLAFLDGEFWLSMIFSDSVKAADLRRDPRLVLHSPTTDYVNDDMSDWRGDAKIAGHGVETVMYSNPEWAAFRIDVTEVVRIYFEADYLVTESWHEGRGLQRHERSHPGEDRIKDEILWRQGNELLVEAGE